MDPSETRAAAEAWLADDPDPDTRAELSSLLDSGDDQALRERFAERLTFGTAGLRGPLGAGPGRLNRLVVRRVTAGLAARIRQEPAGMGGVIIGHDARHKSSEFAEDAARVLVGAGLAVHAFTEPVPTPLLAFAVRALGAVAGVQITASHNPATDNGYKIYWSDGAQISTPVDDEITVAIAAVGPMEHVPIAPPGEGVTPIPAAVREGYLEAALALGTRGVASSLSIVYTPLHGVAAGLLTELLGRAGFDRIDIVQRQAAPDPDFPTVDFPNPEEAGALDLALELAAATGADLLLANDPDGDRIAVALPTPEGWRLLSGDEVGCLVAEHLLARGSGPDRIVGTTVVSSRLLQRIAEDHGVGYLVTLTGFKWLARAAGEAAASGQRFVMAYEQALGVMIGDAVRDKDGMSAALLVAELAAACRAEGRTILDALDDLARRFGLHATAAHSVRLTGSEALVRMAQALDRLRAVPLRAVAGSAVVAVSDHATGERRLGDGMVEPLTTPPTNLLSIELADGSRLQVRPSGTEALLKFYFEVVEPVPAGLAGPAQARARAGARLAELRTAFLAASGLAR